MRLHAILVKHFQPAGVMGGGNPVLLERDLRRCARWHAILYGVLLALLVAVLIGLTFVIVGDIRAGSGLFATVLAVAIIGVIFEAIRRTVRTWSQASLLAQLSRRLEGPQVQSVIGTLIEANE